MKKITLTLCSTLIILNTCIVEALNIQTIFGELKVSDPLLIELIESEGFKRLKGVDQSGPVRYFIQDFPAYSRYDHSLGVFHLLHIYGATYQEQVAGLLHDASHTAFSHVAENVFNHHQHQDSYQDSIHLKALSKLGIQTILEKHHFSFKQANHKGNGYTMLDQELPDLCADRIEYLLHTGYIFQLIDKKDIQSILAHLKYNNGQWYFTDIPTATKLANLSMHFTEGMYASPWNWSMYDWFARMMHRAFEIGIVSSEEFHHATDEQILDKLRHSNDAILQQFFTKCQHNQRTFLVVDHGQYDINLKPKLRAVDPLVLKDKNFLRLSELNPIYHTRYSALKDKLQKGIKIIRIELDDEINKAA